MTETQFKYRGRDLLDADIAAVQAIITANPTASRRALSKIVCEAWGWRQPNGQPKDMICRSLMLALHRSGRILLPEARRRAVNNAIHHRRAEPVLVDETGIDCSLRELGPIDLVSVRKTGDEKTVDGLIHAHHYLGYSRPVGEHIKYLAMANGRPIAAAAWCSAPRHLSPRDRYIGWSADARRKNIRFLAYNTRFLILPWVKVPHLASHLLGRMARSLPTDWEKAYGHGLHYLESFTDPARFKGTCYRAANWVFLGKTTGRGNNAPTYVQRVPIKEILGLPLHPRFRQLLVAIG